MEEVISKEHMSRIQDTVSGKISEDGISDGNVYGLSLIHIWKNDDYMWNIKGSEKSWS